MATIEKLICNLKEEVSKWFYQKGEVDEKVNSKADNSLVTGSSNGLMSSSDKVKLDGVASGANKTVVDSAMSSTSTNPVQNKIIHQELANKSDMDHTHNSLSPTTLGANVDFNDYKTEGTYIISWDSVQSATNAPNKTGGRLEVISVQNGVKQIYHNYGASGSRLKIWWRNYYPTNDTWFDWQSIITTASIDTVLSSTSTNPVQNKAINTALNGKANTNHTHNNYTATTTVSCSYGTVRKFKKNGWAFVVYENINISTLSNEVWTEIADIGWSNQAGNSYTANFQTSIPGDRFRITADGKLSAMRSGDSNHQGHYGYIVYPTSD